MPASNKMDFKKLQSFFFIGLIFAFGITALYIFRPFLYPLFWAAILAITFYPMYLKIEKHLKYRSLSSALSVLIILCMVLIPLLIVATLLVSQSAHMYTQVTQTGLFDDINSVKTKINQIPFVGTYFNEIQSSGPEFARKVAQSASSFLFENFKSLTQYSLRFFALFFLMLYSLYYFFRDGKRMLTRLMHLSPLGDTYEEMLYERFTSTARATLKGTLIIGIVQGSIGGLLFLGTGVDGAVIWGVLMAIFSIVPGIGASLIWFPAGLIMLALGQVWEGITILVVGMFVISLIDNIIRPPLVGRDTQMHPLLILFSTLGGIATFGISGFVIGPVVISLFLAIMNIYDHYYKKELSHN
jgi:predicted PurR-regulated permease PerM